MAGAACPRGRRVARGNCRPPYVHDRHGDAPAPGSAARGIGCAVGPLATMGGCSGTRAANHARRPHRAEPARAFRRGRRRRRHRLG